MAKALNLRGRTKAAELGYGIHDNVVINGISIEDRKMKGKITKRMIFTKLALVDPETRKKIKEKEVAWWKLDHSKKEHLFGNIRELAIQLHGILKCYMGEDEAFEVFGDLFDEWIGDEESEDGKYKTEEAALSGLEAYKWTKKDLDAYMDELKERFMNAIDPFIGAQGKLIRVKLTTNSNGENTEIPRYGVFTETIEEGVEASLRFSAFELKDHSKKGNSESVSKTTGKGSALKRRM